MTETVYCDESGNTGPALLDTDQPVFSLASNNFTEAEATELLGVVRGAATEEAKFSVLKRSARGVEKIVEFLMHPLIRSERVACTIDHKEYMVVTKIVDVIIETMAHRDGIDLYERGANIGLANLHFFATRGLSDPKAFNAMLGSFVAMVRGPSRRNIERFYYWAWKVYRSMPEEQNNVLAPILASERMIERILEENEPRSIDPAVTNVVLHCSVWGSRLPEEFDVVHDQSKPVFAERDVFAAFMDKSIEPKLIGYDRRRFYFPLRARSLSFADSRDVPQLQVSDLLAGAAMTYGVWKVSGKHGEVAEKIERAGVLNLVTGSLWPSMEVDPKNLGTDEVGGINAIEYMTEILSNRKPAN